MRFLKILDHNVNTFVAQHIIFNVLVGMQIKQGVNSWYRLQGEMQMPSHTFCNCWPCQQMDVMALPANSVSMSLHCSPFAKHLNMQHRWGHDSQNLVPQKPGLAV